MDENRRRIKLTAKALENKIEKLQKDHQTQVHKIKGIIKVMKDLMQNDDNATHVRSQLENLCQMVKETTLIHGSVISLIPKQEQEKQNEWFASILKYNNGFMEDTKQWLSETGRPMSNIIPHIATKEITERDENVSCVSKCSGKNMETSVIQDEINPSDSVSNTGSKRTGRRSSARTGSCVSTTSSARIKTEADMGALIASHAASHKSVNSNGMTSYFEKGQGKSHTLCADAESFVPDVNKATVGQLSYYLDTRPKVRSVAQDSRPQLMLSTHTEAKELQSAINITQSHSRLQHQSEHHAGLVPSNCDKSHIITVLERQN